MSAPERPLDETDVTAAVERRGMSAAELTVALELASLEPLIIAPPSPPEDDATADGSEFWHACAFVYAEPVRAARRRFLIAKAASDSEGRPGPIGFGVEHVGVTRADLQTQVMLTFDLLGILGVGRAPAAAALALAEEREVHSELEAAIWAARFRVDRARVGLAAAKARLASLEAVFEEAAPGRRRAELLHERGWVPSQIVATASAIATRMLEAERLALRQEIAMRVQELAQAAGIPPDSRWLHDLGPATLDAFPHDGSLAELPPASALLRRHPTLRARVLGYAVAEARVRAAAAESWPELRLGPMPMIMPDLVLPGGALDLSMPFPGAVAALVRVRMEQRERAREEVEDALLARLTEARVQRDVLEHAILAEALHRESVMRPTAEAWTAARARFGIDASALEGWMMELERRVEAVLLGVTLRESAEVARLNYLEAIGPPPFLEAET